MKGRSGIMSKMEKLEKRIAEIEERIEKNDEIMWKIHKDGADPVTRCWNETEWYECLHENYYLHMEHERLQNTLNQMRSARDRRWIKRMLTA